MAGDTDSLVRSLSAHTSIKTAATKAAAVGGGGAVATSQSGAAQQSSAVGDEEEDDDDDDDAAATATGVLAKTKTDRPVSRRNHQELEELAR